MRSLVTYGKRCLLALTALMIATSPGSSIAADGDLGRCERLLNKALGKYSQCVHVALARFYEGEEKDIFQGRFETCYVRYERTWDRVSTLTEGPCSAASRFEDNGDGTVTDNLTGLEWEVKTDDGGVHDKDNLYAMDPPGDTTASGTGTAFSVFLNTINDAGFGGHKDWRLPNVLELRTVMTADPIFGSMPPIPDFGANTRLHLGPEEHWHIFLGDRKPDHEGGGTSTNWRVVRRGR